MTKKSSRKWPFFVGFLSSSVGAHILSAVFFVTDQSRLLFSFWVKSSPKFCRKKCAKKCACRGDWKILKRLFPTSSSDAKCSFFWQNFFLYFQFLTFFFWKTQLFLYFYVVFCALLTSNKELGYRQYFMVSI